MNEEKNQVAKAVRDLRESLNESQQLFAYRMKAAIRTIARYETVRPPRGAELAKFYKLAIDTGNVELAKVFGSAMAQELKMNPGTLPRTPYESAAVGLLLNVMRNRKGWLGNPRLGSAEVSAKYDIIRDALIEGASLLVKKYRPGYMYVYGLDEEGFETLKSDLEAMKKEPAVWEGKLP